MTTTFYVNLFHNGFLKYTGFKKSLKADSEGGVRPVMLPINSFRKAVKFPYRLNEEDNIKRFSSGEVEVAFLVPTSDVENLTDDQLNRSLYSKLVGDTGNEAEELRSKLKEKDNVIGMLRKQKRQLEQEEEEQNKGGSTSGRGGNGLKCPECGDSNSKSVWENNHGLCPSCQSVDMSNPGVVRE